MSAPQQPGSSPHQHGSSERLEVGRDSSPQQRPRWVAVTAVVVLVALALGGLGGFLIARVGSDPRTPDSAAVACQLVAELESGNVADWDLESPELWQTMAVGPMLRAAALENPDHRGLGAAGDDLQTAVQTFDKEKLSASIDKIHQLCADI